MINKILNEIIRFCVRRVGFIYDPYLVIATINTKRAEKIIEELKKKNITNKEDYLRWEEDYLNYVKNNVDFLSKK